jgi:hypothetical protein
LGPELLGWYKEPRTIFVGSQDTLNPSPDSSLGSFLASVYLFTKEKKPVDNVRQRLCLTALATVVDKLEGVYLTDSLVEQVADIIDPKRGKDQKAKVLKGGLKSLLGAASRYRLLSEELGIGELCCLPPATGDSL